MYEIPKKDALNNFYLCKVKCKSICKKKEFIVG